MSYFENDIWLKSDDRNCICGIEKMTNAIESNCFCFPFNIIDKYKYIGLEDYKTFQQDAVITFKSITHQTFINGMSKANKIIKDGNNQFNLLKFAKDFEAAYIFNPEQSSSITPPHFITVYTQQLGIDNLTQLSSHYKTDYIEFLKLDFEESVEFTHYLQYIQNVFIHILWGIFNLDVVNYYRSPYLRHSHVGMWTASWDVENNIHWNNHSFLYEYDKNWYTHTTEIIPSEKIIYPEAPF